MYSEENSDGPQSHIDHFDVFYLDSVLADSFNQHAVDLFGTREKLTDHEGWLFVNSIIINYQILRTDHHLLIQPQRSLFDLISHQALQEVQAVELLNELAFALEILSFDETRQRGKGCLFVAITFFLAEFFNQS